jgi:hypothetical protein
MAEGMLRYRCIKNDSPSLELCTSLERPDFVISDSYEDQTYTLSLTFTIGKYTLTATVSGDPDEQFTADGALLTLRHDDKTLSLEDTSRIETLMSVLGDKPIKDTDIIGILTDKLTFLALSTDLIQSIGENLA